MLNPTYKINYHDRQRGADYVNSRSYDGPAIVVNKKLREELAPIPSKPRPQVNRSLHPAMQHGQESKELSLQEKIRMINDANMKRHKIGANSPNLSTLLENRQAALPQIVPLHKSKEMAMGKPQLLPPVSSRILSSVAKKTKHMMQPPEWWG